MAVHPSTFHPLRLHRSLAPLPLRDRASLGPDGRRRRLEAAPRIVLSRRSRGHSSAASSSEGFEPSRRKDRSGAPIGSPAHRSSASAIDFLTLCHRLKTTKRKGWINQGIDGPESIADHMYRMALMALIADDLPGLDRERCIKIAIVHDIAEAIVGDITPADGVPKEEKSRREQAALDEMCQVLGGGMRAEEIKELWAEYENNSSLEANLVKDFDKVELILQALEYEIGNAPTYCLSITWDGAG
ncbi:uncharacterized protein LOC115672048 isoform X2 [Syzygium oleosum]|uniref:uncharacterized protein LOC115672048 isoform X2 n=1 Tax=Syzygium oleosum TaxID=219896 RepID=UPI0024BB033C|nr:uncharacterized protein LOC115672048 isoform X2 [Syzygium oleosum]